MKTLISFIVFLSLVSLTGCSFLKAGVESEDPEETAYSEEIDEEEGYEGDFQEDEDIAGEEYEDTAEEEGLEESDTTVEEEGDGEDLDEDEPEGKKKKGFFARLFGWGEDSEDLDEEEDFQEDEESDDFEGDEDLDEYTEDEAEESMEDGFAESSEKDDGAADTESDSVTTEAPKPQEQPSTSTDEASTQSDVSPPSVTDTSSTELPAQIPNLVSVKKIKTRAYRKGAYLVNAVYIARTGDSIESVSQKIYNANQQKVLYTINPHFRSRTLKVGDKIYYNSPHRPQDSSRILIYYEELGIPSQTHLISSGQNIRSVSRKLLGHKDSWKEIWATNPGILSKGIVSEPTELRYWPKDTSASLPPAPESHAEKLPSIDQQPEIAGKQEGSEGKTPLALEGESDKTAQQPPADQEIPEPVAISENKKLNIGQIFLIGAFAVAILFSLMMVFKKRRKQREFDYTATNIKPPS